MLQFQVDPGLIACVQDRIAGRDDLYWLIGGSCTGKSTLSKALEAAVGIQRYDLDARIYGDFIPHYNPDRHPASATYFSEANPFAWALSLEPSDLDKLNRAANAEYLDLLTMTPWAFRTYYAGGYALAVSRFPFLYGIGYFLTNRPHRPGRGIGERYRLWNERRAMRRFADTTARIWVASQPTGRWRGNGPMTARTFRNRAMRSFASISGCSGETRPRASNPRSCWSRTSPGARTCRGGQRPRGVCSRSSRDTPYANAWEPEMPETRYMAPTST